MKIPRRSLLTGTSALAALAAMRERANAANVPFTTFAFDATGSTTPRTMPNRLADIHNVLDFGADASGTNDSTSAIQSAVNWTSGANRGTIFFPLGTYKISSPITFNTSGINIHFRGEGDGTFLNGVTATSGFVLDRSLGSPSNTGQVIIENFNIGGFTGTVAGAIRVGSCNSVVVRDCHLGGSINLTTEDSAGNSSTGILLENVIFPGGDTGLIMGGSGAVIGCDWTACTVGARMYGNGWFMSGNRMEECNTCYLIGKDSAGTNQTTSGFAVCSGSTEGCLLSMDFAGPCSAFYVGQMGFQGHSNSGIPPTTTPTNYGVFVRANTASNGVFQGIVAVGDLFAIAALEVDAASSRANLLFLGCSFNKGAAYLVVSSGTYVSGTGVITLTMAVAPSFVGGASVTLASLTGTGAFAALDGIWPALSVVGTTVTLQGPVGAGAATITGGLATAGVDVIAPSNAYTCQFQLCTFGTYVPVWTFSQLPTVGGGNDQEGDEYSITDSTTNTWGANVTVGSGADPVLVRNNGTHYTVVAK